MLCKAIFFVKNLISTFERYELHVKQNNMSIISQTDQNTMELLAENTRLKEELNDFCEQKDANGGVMRTQAELKFYKMKYEDLKADLVIKKAVIEIMSEEKDSCALGVVMRENEVLKKEIQDMSGKWKIASDDAERLAKGGKILCLENETLKEDKICRIILFKELKEMKKWMESKVKSDIGPEWSWSDDKMAYRNSTYEYDSEEDGDGDSIFDDEEED
jgi:hypothetical protein